MNLFLGVEKSREFFLSRNEIFRSHLSNWFSNWDIFSKKIYIFYEELKYSLSDHSLICFSSLENKIDSINLGKSARLLKSRSCVSGQFYLALNCPEDKAKNCAQNITFTLSIQSDLVTRKEEKFKGQRVLPDVRPRFVKKSRDTQLN